MIPKILHYCWFGKDEIPDNLKKCMDSWSIYFNEYEIMRWDESSFDVNSTMWTKQAYNEKKYAFVSDYVRLYALEKYGGIYLDTDVMIRKSFTPFLKFQAFGGFENDLYLTSAVIGCEAHFSLIKEFLEYYKGRSFLMKEGGLNNEANVIMITNVCKKYGLQINDKEQEIMGFHIYPKEYFCPIDFYHNKNITENSFAIHYFDASWLDSDTKKMIQKERKWWYKMYIIIKRYGIKLLRRRR